LSERRRQWLFRAVSVVLGCGIGLGLVEGIGALALRLADAEEPALPAELEGRILESGRTPPMLPDPWLGYRPEPGGSTPHARVNGFGLRGPEIEERPEPGVFRILLLGGSVAWGYTAVSDEETIAVALARHLNARRRTHPVLRERTIEVLNGAVPGYVAWQGALAYALRHRRLGPHLVVALDGANEYAAAVNSGVAGVPLRFDPNPPSRSPRPTLLGVLGDWSSYRLGRLQLAKYLEHARRPSLAERAPPSGEAVARSHGEALDHLADLASLEGAVVVPVLQPLAILPGSKPLTPFEQRLVEHHERQVPGINAAFAETYAATRRVFAELAARRPAVLPLDATSVFAGVQEIAYVDHCHLTPLGRERLAAAIGDWILERLGDGPRGIPTRP
jgi:hypothetical protein